MPDETTVSSYSVKSQLLPSIQQAPAYLVEHHTAADAICNSLLNMTQKKPLSSILLPAAKHKLFHMQDSSTLQLTQC